ncbi:hypothetical protein TPA0598_04_03040 [Streptomyces lydicamycinicus]|uniref:Uncharacterized protein n=1 Tax=Streptomyces lydicamycinicus TaxID=1546107 RepID=A0A0P4R6A9_9ACTN|nr:hypothetical protein [Streptomyces lydicamycinicus]GAO08668.1 hypothetical protein TPA0598_04_03040 [Streptomyces lydicamycinicus]
MGYDIYIQTPDGKPAEGDENYFRFAITAMPRTLDAMSNFGMLVDLPIPSYPTLAAYGLKREDFQPGAKPDQATATRIAEYRAAYQAVTDAAEPDPTGIPAYKLAWSDGFLVTVAEISAALATYEAHPQVEIAEMPVGDPTWRRWIAFLRRARAHGGLRTH